MCESRRWIHGIQSPRRNANSLGKSQHIRNLVCLKVVLVIGTYPYHCAVRV